jgi:hypothetical protein
MQACPKCGYVRKPSDTAPEWQCPNCQIAYAKVGIAPHGHPANAKPGAGSGPSVKPDPSPASLSEPDPQAYPEDEDAVEATELQRKIAAGIEIALVIGALGLVALQGFLARRTYAFILLALPWVAIALVAFFEQRFTYRYKDRHEGAMARSSVAMLLLVPAFALLTLADRYYWVNDDSAALGYALTLGLAMMAIAVATSVGLRWRWWLIGGMLVKTSLYAYGAVLAVNVLFDHRTPDWDVLVVDSKNSRYVSKQGEQYYLYAHYLRKPQHTTSVHVSEGWYGQKKGGDYVCIFRHPGFLHMPWNWVSECPPTSSAERRDQLIEHGIQHIAELLRFNQIRDDGFQRRVNARIRAEFAALTGDETFRRAETLAEAALEREGFVFVDDKGKPLHRDPR